MHVSMVGVVVDVNDVERGDMISHRKDWNSGVLGISERIVESFFQVETVGNDEDGIVDEFDVAWRRFEVVWILAIGNDRDHIGYTIDELSDYGCEHGVGHHHIRQVDNRGAGGFGRSRCGWLIDRLQGVFVARAGESEYGKGSSGDGDDAALAQR